jgi:hypothetical protein
MSFWDRFFEFNNKKHKEDVIKYHQSIMEGFKERREQDEISGRFSDEILMKHQIRLNEEYNNKLIFENHLILKGKLYNPRSIYLRKNLKRFNTL